jgi:hypothetical protein
MDEERRADRILDFLRSKGLRGCPVCNQEQFAVGPEHLLVRTDQDPEQEWLLGQVVVPVACGNCGHTMLFSPRMFPGA